MLIDSHCHLDHEEFCSDRAAVLARSRAADVSAWVVPGYSPKHWCRLQSLGREENGVGIAFGVHPLFLDDLVDADWSRLEQLLGHAVAVGEVGLDQGPGAPALERQLPVLQKQLEMARSLRLPVILHARGVTEVLLQALRPWVPIDGVWHSFSGSPEQAQKATQMGLRLGFGGAVTHPRAVRLQRVLRSLPAQALLLETDAPFQSGSSHRGQRNEPAYLSEIVDFVADLRGNSHEGLAKICYDNTLRAFPRLEQVLSDV